MNFTAESIIVVLIREDSAMEDRTVVIIAMKLTALHRLLKDTESCNITLLFFNKFSLKNVPKINAQTELAFGVLSDVTEPSIARAARMRKDVVSHSFNL